MCTTVEQVFERFQAATRTNVRTFSGRHRSAARNRWVSHGPGGVSVGRSPSGRGRRTAGCRAARPTARAWTTAPGRRASPGSDADDAARAEQRDGGVRGLVDGEDPRRRSAPAASRARRGPGRRAARSARRRGTARAPARRAAPRPRPTSSPTRSRPWWRRTPSSRAPGRARTARRCSRCRRRPAPNAASAARIPHRQPSRLTSTSRCTCSSVRSASRPSSPTPALLNHAVSRPRSLAVVATNRCAGRVADVLLEPDRGADLLRRTTRAVAVDVGDHHGVPTRRPSARRCPARSPAPRRSPHSCPCPASQPEPLDRPHASPPGDDDTTGPASVMSHGRSAGGRDTPVRTDV